MLADYDGDGTWADPLKRLSDVDWSKTNPDWQGVCMIGAEVITRRQTRSALADLLSWKIGIAESPPEKVLEPS